VTVFSKNIAGKIIDNIILTGAILHWVNWDVTEKLEIENKPKLIKLAVWDAVYKAKKSVSKLGYHINSINYVKLNDSYNQDFSRLAPTSNLYGVNKSLKFSVDLSFDIELKDDKKK
jgi:hypothetical protein